MKNVYLLITATIAFFVIINGEVRATGDWPQQIVTEKAKILLYQPQPDSLRGDHLFSRSAVSVTITGKEPVFGSIWTDVKLNIDREERRFSLLEVKVVNVRFPNQEKAGPEKINQLKQLIEQEVPKWNLTGSVDELLATLSIAKTDQNSAEDFNNAPPEIIFKKEPSVLVVFDGEPKFIALEKSTLKRAVNTPFYVVQDPKTFHTYLYGGDYWFATTDMSKGKWSKIKQPPPDVKKLQEQLEKQGMKKQEAKPQDPKSPPPVPQVIIRTSPAELIQSAGEPKFVPIEGTQLLYISNTDDNIFMYIDNQVYYILIGGRWYSAKSLDGPWAYVEPGKLPADFAKIPEETEKDIVLASVPGTAAAKEAILDAQIPQTAAVNRKSASCTVKYDGDPKFEQIKGTLLFRAMNTASTVIQSGSSYYVCDDAVWFKGNSPTGPWSVATEIPAEIKKIPPEDPSYHVKYVYIYDVTPEVVYVGYTPGYMGCYIAGPVIVYGTGFYYPSWYGPYYYPHPATWGFSMHYNPWTGWSMGFSYSVGFFTFSVGVPMFPAGWWGPPVFHPPFYVPCNHFYGPRPVYVKNTNITVNNINVNQNNIYHERGSGVRENPNRQDISRTDRTSGQTSSRTGASKLQNNVYSDKNGDVYRKEGNNWQKNDGTNWKPADEGRSSGAAREGGFDKSNFERQSTDRARGSQRSYNQGNFRSGTGGARASGGAMRRR